MSNTSAQRSQNGVNGKVGILAALFLFTAVTMPGIASADSNTCNPDLDFTVLNEGPYFIDDALTIHANMGAKDIVGGTYLDISAFGFATDCKPGEDFHTCDDEGAGNDVEFLENFETNCKGADGSDTQLFVPQSGIVPIKVAGSPIRTTANTQCYVEFDMAITGLAEDNTDGMIYQAIGWPIVNEEPAKCDNGLTASATSTIAYPMNSCDINVVKEVSFDGETWHDANSNATAPKLGPDNTAYYRLKVWNESSVDFIGDLQVRDATLLGEGVTVDVAQDFDENGYMIIEGPESGFDIAKACADLIEGGVGYFTNTASVEGTCRGPEHSMGKVSAMQSDIAIVNCLPYDPRGNAGVLIEKATNGEDADSAPGPFVPVGGDVNWTFVVSNPGKQPITIDSVIDDMEGTVSCEETYLDLGEFTNCSLPAGTAVKGQYENSVTVKATAAGNGQKVQDDDPSHYFGMEASIQLVKTADTDPFTTLGQLITYTFEVTNTGNVQLTGVDVVDNSLPGLSDVVCDDTTLDPAESTNCEATYNIKQSDLDAGQVYNTATAYGTDPNGKEVTDTDDETIYSTPVEELTLLKTAAPSTYSQVGDVISYSYKLTNSGNVTLYAPYSVMDDVIDAAGGSVDCSGLAPSIAPNAFVMCTASYTIGAGDIGAGSVQNFATAYAKDAPEDGNDVASNQDDETVYYIGITILKEIWDGEAYVAADSAEDAAVHNYPHNAMYRIVVQNVGQVALNNVTLTDGLLGIDENLGMLNPGQTVTLVTDDLEALTFTGACDESETVQNTAYVSGAAATSGLLVGDNDSAFLKCVGTPEIVIKKYIWDPTLDVPDYVDGTAGPVQFPSGALYKITVENTGQVDLVDLVINDSMIPNDPINIASLAKTEVYTITDGVIDATGDRFWSDLNMATVCGSSGPFQNIADVKATSADSDEDTTDSDDAFLDCIGPPQIDITKLVSLDGGVSYVDANGPQFPTSLVGAGVDALYKLVVENIGSVPLVDVVINDEKLGIVNHPVGSLAVGQTVTLLQGDISELQWVDICSSTGEKSNVADVTGSSLAGVSHQAFDSATVDCIGNPAIRVTKQVSTTGAENDWHDTVSDMAPSDAYYRIIVKNIGNVELVDVKVSDSILGITNFVPVGSGGEGVLAVDEEVVITHSGLGDNVIPGLWVEELCDGTEPEYVNTATASGDASDTAETVNAEDTATFLCNTPVVICGGEGAISDTKPILLKMIYDGTYDSDHHQGTAPEIDPDITGPMPDTVRVVSYSKKKNGDIMLNELKGIGEDFFIGGWGGDGRIPSNILIEFYGEGDEVGADDPLQSVIFHGSCSAPLVQGDEFGGATIIGFTLGTN